MIEEKPLADKAILPEKDLKTSPPQLIKQPDQAKPVIDSIKLSNIESI
jgi:hypothetical protein